MTPGAGRSVDQEDLAGVEVLVVTVLVRLLFERDRSEARRNVADHTRIAGETDEVRRERRKVLLHDGGVSRSPSTLIMTTRAALSAPPLDSCRSLSFVRPPGRRPGSE